MRHRVVVGAPGQLGLDNRGEGFGNRIARLPNPAMQKRRYWLLTPSTTKAISVLILELAVVKLLAVTVPSMPGSPTPWKFKSTAGASH